MEATHFTIETHLPPQQEVAKHIAGSQPLAFWCYRRKLLPMTPDGTMTGSSQHITGSQPLPSGTTKEICLLPLLLDVSHVMRLGTHFICFYVTGAHKTTGEVAKPFQSPCFQLRRDFTQKSPMYYHGHSYPMSLPLASYFLGISTICHLFKKDPFKNLT